MIRQLRGAISDIETQGVTVENNGVGYLVCTTAAPESYSLDQDVHFFIYHAIRDNGQDLYGFATRDEREIFELLLTIPKVGPKTALQFLRQADPELLRQAVANEDASYLSKMSGIGKKSAEKIIIGLKDKLDSSTLTSQSTDSETPATQSTTDAIDALAALGYPHSEARKAVQNAQKNHPELVSSAEVVRVALQTLNS
ncbi:MAG: Holliday junction branch migration protein RuvA [Candidatus Paceibacterota bacterium]